MFVRDWMSREAVTVERDASLLEARDLFNHNQFRHLPVVHDGALVGVITQTDLVAAFAQLDVGTEGTTSNRRLVDARVQEHMSHPAIRVGPDETIEIAALLLREHRIGALPVVERGSVVGILTETNIFDGLIDALGLAEGGARMVFELEPGEEHRQVDDVMRQFDRQGLRLTSLATYHSNEDPSNSRCVVRARGRSA